MTCESAIIKDLVTISPEITVGEAYDVLKKEKIRNLVVVDSEGALQGVLGFQQIIRHVLPFSATMDDGINDLEFMHIEASDVAEKFNDVRQKKVSDIMEPVAVTVTPKTTFMEVVFLLFKHGSPIPVVDPETGKLVGIVTKQSALFNLDARFGKV